MTIIHKPSNLTNGQFITESDLFNPNLLFENANVKDLGVALVEAQDFIRDSYYSLKEKDAAYDIKSHSINESASSIANARVQLIHEFGEFASKAVEWAKKIFNSVKSFFVNVWLKLTNKWEYRKRQMKDKDFYAKVQMAKSSEKWENTKAVMLSAENIDTSIEKVIAEATGLANNASPDDIQTAKENIKDLIETLRETETYEGKELDDKLTAAITLYSNNITKQANELKKFEQSIGKMIDQFIKNLKAKSPSTKASSKLYAGSDSNKFMGQTVSADIGDKNDSNAFNLDKEKKAIPVVAGALHQIAAVIKTNAEYSWRLIEKAASVGGYDMAKLKSLR